MKKENTLYIFSNGRVAALRKSNGDIVWEVKLKDYLSVSTAYYVGQIIQDDDKLYVGVAGHILCLKTLDGSLVWKNELKGWGYQLVSIAGAYAQEHGEANRLMGAAAT